MLGNSIEITFEKVKEGQEKIGIIREFGIALDFDLESNYIESLSKLQPIDMSKEVVDSVYKELSFDEKFFLDKEGNIWRNDQVEIVRNKLESYGYELDTNWYRWGAKRAEKVENVDLQPNIPTNKEVLAKLSDFIYKNPQIISERLKQLIINVQIQIKKDSDINRRILKEIFKEIYNQNDNIHNEENFFELIDNMKSYAPYFWLELNRDELKYIKEFEPKFESYYNAYQDKSYDPYLGKVIQKAEPGYYHPDFSKVQDPQDNILKRQWGGRCAMTGNLIGNQKITRHHYKLGDKNKIDCSISALVPIITIYHSTRGDPHSEIYVKRFEEAKFYIERGISYIPYWWNKDNRMAYKAFLETNKIPYVEGKI
ncbi:MAG: hypothetical protein P8Y97_22995 [Candidatus Lokiarchaeota archaeon]